MKFTLASLLAAGISAAAVSTGQYAQGGFGPGLDPAFQDNQQSRIINQMYRSLVAQKNLLTDQETLIRAVQRKAKALDEQLDAAEAQRVSNVGDGALIVDYHEQGRIIELTSLSVEDIDICILDEQTIEFEAHITFTGEVDQSTVVLSLEQSATEVARAESSIQSPETMVLLYRHTNDAISGTPASLDYTFKITYTDTTSGASTTDMSAELTYGYKVYAKGQDVSTTEPSQCSSDPVE